MSTSYYIYFKIFESIQLCKLSFCLLVIPILFLSCSSEVQKQEVMIDAPKNVQRLKKARTIITTDGEVDDIDSFIRMLLFANEFDIEAMVYSSSQWHYKGDGKGTKFTSEMQNTEERYGTREELRWPGTTWMQSLLEKYEVTYPSLALHAEGFPEPAYLKSIVKVGNIDFEGEMEIDTEGSNFIKNILLDEDTSAVYIQAWGGSNTFARALKAIEEEFKDTDQWNTIYEHVSKKAIFYAILDQDATYKKYIGVKWPKIRVIYNSDQFWCFAYPWPERVPEPFHQYFNGSWFSEHILNNHSPLLSEYYSWGDGRQVEGDYEQYHGDTTYMKEKGREKFDFISEGDSPAYFFLMNVGLNDTKDPRIGGWGGRFVQSPDNPYRWEDGEQVQDYNPYTSQYDKSYPQARWVDALQNEFAARADWCIKPYEEANHPPKVSIEGNNIQLVEKGAKITLTAKASDPDGDELSYNWWQYEEVSSYQNKITVDTINEDTLTLTVPNDANSGEDIHLILEVKDNGKHPLTRYKRVVLKVQ